MSILTDQLSLQLINNRQYPIVRDEGSAEWFTGRELEEDVARLKDVFTAHAIGRGDVVLVCLPNSAVHLVINQALWELGAVVHPISATTPGAQILAIRAEYRYPAFIADPDRLAVLPAGWTDAPVALHTQAPLFLYTPAVWPADKATMKPAVGDEDDLAMILQTSGTTGKPKRVGITHRQLLNAARHDIASHHMSETDTALVVMPMFHVNAQVISVLSTRLSGGKLVIAPQFSAHLFWQQVRDNHVTWTSVVPTIISILLLNAGARAAYSPDLRLRFVRCSSFALPEDKLRAFQRVYHTQVIEGYGMTETVSQCTVNPFAAPKIGSAGKPYATEVQLLPVDQQPTTAPNVLGEIIVRGDHVITDYLDLNPNAFWHGWFRTGDLGSFDADGYLYIKGRTKEIISHGGEKVAPAEVENVLNGLDFVAQVAVVGVPDPLYGENVTAVVVSTTPGVHEAEQKQTLAHYAHAHLAKYERPTTIIFRTTLPRNATGKVIRPQLTAELREKGLANET
ncbi:AMP-binding protein [Schleiferilactobacillus shenzhenensis]|uniref:FadD15 n=1 Tax=Schleiferilactobacillus shenzhenensis LY-73 TaxID=1231336 RepID=U4TR24_9LACO|nr:AMP-binding protein [Schleiferilactobacillus shenzhenensis]ERL63962.1 FadD15 [Schleiferilactobacillus shenzhenensis LY-73]